ncbi:MAG: bifunctional adenosylcobinamide kinase/adenosylcobinamide-phosphate guanylyltransferase [Flavobacteriales bacterium]|nr:bifunctional adenosylcobinamide kinase/adenosylcobinamide-phosphate guanylyltransferase [Flavobacteriales bacterium]MCB9449075.1 bifunctional adenosylcobinamide kinase/adenosylcobinamide-phosphate guanylyltransferase [Flavobacteriales bacterium]
MIYLITGGARSGKSSHALRLAESMSATPMYIATARIWDTDFKKRVDRHKQERGDNWTSIEEEKHIGTLELENKVVVIDCLTLWLTNLFTDHNQNMDNCLNEARQNLDALAQQQATVILVTNEIGMGVHAHTETGRRFTDLQGWTNQHAASLADEVILMVSGIPVTVKS